MRYTLFFLGACLCTGFLIYTNSGGSKKQTVNPILGDISFEKKFGHKPAAATSNELRIATHLEYAENMLRQKETAHLSVALKEKRNHLLDLLHQYRVKGLFPQNLDHPEERKPCFIDKDGRICAVGYLVEQTASREVAESINEKYKYEELLAMNDKTLDDWVEASGLTKEECAMIQPTYGWPTPPAENYSKISTSYGISSSVVGGIGLSLNAINAIQLLKGTGGGKAIPVAGLIVGAGQVVLGIANMPKEQTNALGVKYTNGSQQTLSMINIGLGATSMALSAWNLIANRKPKDKPVSWNIYSFPTPDNSTGFGFSLTKRL
ncbi:MAG: hypothetical protein V4685_14760 [Bacteroidota bacterium]